MAILEDRAYKFLYLRRLHEHHNGCALLDLCTNRQHMHKEQDIAQASDGLLLLVYAKDPLNNNILHFADDPNVVDILRLGLALKMDIAGHVPALQRLLPVLRAVHLPVDDQLPLGPHRQLEVRVFLPEIRLPAQEHPL